MVYHFGINLKILFFCRTAKIHFFCDFREMQNGIKIRLSCKILYNGNKNIFAEKYSLFGEFQTSAFK